VFEARQGKMTDKGRRSLGRQAQMMPLLASMTDQTVAGMGPPGVGVTGLLWREWEGGGVAGLTCWVSVLG